MHFTVINAHYSTEVTVRPEYRLLSGEFSTLSIVPLCKKSWLSFCWECYVIASDLVQPLFWRSRRVEAVAPVPLSEIRIAKARRRDRERPVSQALGPCHGLRAEVTVNGASVALERGRRAPKVKVLTVRNYWTSTCHPPIFGLYQPAGYQRYRCVPAHSRLPHSQTRSNISDPNFIGGLQILFAE